MGGAVATAAIIGLTGCGVGGGADDTGSAAADGEITGDIVFQTWNLKGGYEDYFTSLIAEFEKENPGTHIEWKDQPAEGYQASLSADAAAGNLPDVVDMGPEAAYSLADAGIALDITTVDEDAQDLYLPKAWEAMTFKGLGGGTYGFPWYLNTGPQFFNTELFEKCGLDPEDLPTTEDELFEQAAIMGKNCDDVSMYGRLPAIENFGAYGVQLMNDDETEFTFNEPRGVEYLQKYIDLYKGAGLNEDSIGALQTGEVDAFKKGDIASIGGSSYTMKDLRETAPQIYDNVAVTPAIATEAPNMYIESLVVNSQSKNTATAIAFSEFVTNVENQTEFAKSASVFPSAAGALDDPFFTENDGSDDALVRSISAGQLDKAVVWWPPAFAGESSAEYFRDQIGQAVLGKKTAQEALDDAVAYANERIALSE